jgi:hypothetical protein
MIFHIIALYRNLSTISSWLLHPRIQLVEGHVRL